MNTRLIIIVLAAIVVVAGAYIYMGDEAPAPELPAATTSTPAPDTPVEPAPSGQQN